MTNDRHERVLRQFFVEEAAGAAPPDLLGRSLARTVTARRRPTLYARMRGVGIAGPVSVGLPGVRVAYVLVILGVVLAALLAAIAAGSFRTRSDHAAGAQRLDRLLLAGQRSFGRRGFIPDEHRRDGVPEARRCRLSVVLGQRERARIRRRGRTGHGDREPGRLLTAPGGRHPPVIRRPRARCGARAVA